MPTGVLSFCFDYATRPDAPLPGVFTSVREKFSSLATTDLPKLVRDFYAFRNKYVAHAAADLTDRDLARKALAQWMQTLLALQSAMRE